VARRRNYGGSFAGGLNRGFTGKVAPVRETGSVGSTRYPTVIEAYNRDSDYKRWKQGQSDYFGESSGWVVDRLLTRANLVAAPAADGLKLITTLAPASMSPERSWHTVVHVRGSVIMPSAITAARITLDQSSADSSEHRLVYDVNGILSPDQISAAGALGGLQFEDSATGPNYPDDLIGDALGAIALTLVDVRRLDRELVFDLSRPWTRAIRGGRPYWVPLEYDPAAPVYWEDDGSRFLCNSFAFGCSCPDHQARTFASRSSAQGRISQRIPLTTAGRDPATAWEEENAGFYRQWRTLSPRQDERRACKHIHSARWECGVPFEEPSDYPTGGVFRFEDQRRAKERSATFEEVAEFQARQLLDYDLWVPAMALTMQLNLDPEGRLRPSAAQASRPTSEPILWNDSQLPDPDLCRINDWWLKRGTNDLQAFIDPGTGFSDQISGSPVLEFMEASDPLAPQIVI
jgi:hypothetical protein